MRMKLFFIWQDTSANVDCLFPKCALPRKIKPIICREDLGDTVVPCHRERTCYQCFFRRGKRVASQNDPSASCYSICRGGWIWFFPLLSSTGVQPTLHSVGFELLQILLPESYRYGVSGRQTGRWFPENERCPAPQFFRYFPCIVIFKVVMWW